MHLPIYPDLRQPLQRLTDDLCQRRPMTARKTCLACTFLWCLVQGAIAANEGSCTSSRGSNPLAAALEYLDKHQEEAQQDVLQLARFPSISSMPEYGEHVREAGRWLVRRLRKAGLEVTHLYFTFPKKIFQRRYDCLF